METNILMESGTNEVEILEFMVGNNHYGINVAKIKEMLDNLREHTPEKFGDFTVLSARDYDRDVIVDMKTGEKKPTGLPKSNVLYYDLNDGAWCCARPSGTEPKIKFYMGVKGTSLEDAQAKLDELTQAVMDLVQG